MSHLATLQASRLDVVRTLLVDPTALPEIALQRLLRRAAPGLHADPLLWVGSRLDGVDEAFGTHDVTCLATDELVGSSGDLPEATFGGAVCLSGLGTDQDAALVHGLAHALKPDGWLLAATSLKADNGRPRREVGELRRYLRHLLANAGFVNLIMVGTTGSWATNATLAAHRVRRRLGSWRTASRLADRLLGIAAIGAWLLDRYFGHSGAAVQLVVLGRKMRSGS